MTDIFDEVDEDLQFERAQRLLRRHGWLIVVLAIGVVAGVGGWKFWEWRQAQAEAAASTSYMAASRQATPVAGVATEAGKKAALSGFEDLAAAAPSGYRDLARLRVAALKADLNDVPGALAIWNQMADDASTDPLLRDLARLFWAQHQIDQGDPQLVQSRLQALMTPDNPFHAMAQEGLALLSLRQGNKDAAKAAFQTLAQDAGAPEGMRARARDLLTRLGG